MKEIFVTGGSSDWEFDLKESIYDVNILIK